MVTLVACAPYEPNPALTPTSPPVVLQVTASTTLLPAASALAEAYRLRANPSVIEGELLVNVEGRPANQVIETLQHGTTDMAFIAGPLPNSQLADMEITAIGQVPLAIVVHRSNPVQSLTLAQVRNIFAGEILDWESVGKKPGPILVVTQPPGSEAWTALTTLVLGQTRIMRGAVVAADDQGVGELVTREPGAIGYAALGTLPPDVRVVALDGIRPTPAELAAGRYPLVEPVYLLTLSDPPAHVRGLVDFALSPAGQEVLRDLLGRGGGQ